MFTPKQTESCEQGDYLIASGTSLHSQIFSFEISKKQNSEPAGYWVGAGFFSKYLESHFQRRFFPERWNDLVRLDHSGAERPGFVYDGRHISGGEYLCLTRMAG